MAYALIAVAVLLALAPLWHFFPSRRQRQLAGMRETAALGGLFVEFRDLPLPDYRLVRMPAAERQVLYYGRRLRHATGKPPKSAAWWRDEGAWRARPGVPAPPAIAHRLPPTVLAIGVEEGGCGCYWREEGDVESVQQIAALLEEWAAELAAGG